MKKMITLAAVLCCAMTSTMAIAQDNMDEVVKEVEQRVKMADKNPSDGKLQLQAGRALLSYKLGDKIDFERSMTYANRAQKIAESQTVLKDTLKGGVYLLLSDLYLRKQDGRKAFDYAEMGLEALSQELGRYDRWTIFQKLYVGYFTMMYLDTRRGSLMIQQAFLDSELAPAEKRIQNITELSALYEMALEYSMADIAIKMNHGLPVIVFEGKRYLMLETSEWNMEKPLVGWLMPNLMQMIKGEEDESETGLILCEFDDVDAPLRYIKPEDENRPEFKVTVAINPTDHSLLNIPKENTILWFLDEPSYNKVLEKYHAFKASKGK